MTTKRLPTARPPLPLAPAVAVAAAALAILAGCAGTPAPSAPEPGTPKLVAPYRALDPDAPPVTARTLLESERFWPYRVKLTEPLPAPGLERPLPEGRAGVLIRVEPSGDPRIDFGGLGKYAVPLEKTDLVERANRIRRGALDKWGPNFVHAIRTRLLDAEGERPVRLDPEEVAAYRGFLCVFARPAEPGFDALAGLLAPLSERHGEDVLTLLFPLGRMPDAEMHARLAALGWRVPFVYGFLAEGYARSLLADATEVPSVLLQSPEGRLLFHGRPSAEGVAELAGVLAAEYGEPAALATTTGE